MHPLAKLNLLPALLGQPVLGFGQQLGDRVTREELRRDDALGGLLGDRLGAVFAELRDLAAAGVKLLGEVGLGSVKDGETARTMVAWARKYGIQSTIHTGGPSIPGSGLIDKDVVLEADTDVVGHINGGHTALPDDQIRCICEGCKRGLELVHNGNERSALYTLRIAREMGDLSRVILGTDAPAGSGVQPLGILRMVSLLSSLGELPAVVRADERRLLDGLAVRKLWGIGPVAEEKLHRLGIDTIARYATSVGIGQKTGGCEFRL